MSNIEEGTTPQIDMSDVVIYWPAIEGDDELGDMPALRLTIPRKYAGKLEIYKVPVCTDYPSGYWVKINGTEGDSMPGCAAWEMIKLAVIGLAGIPMVTYEDGDTNYEGNMLNVVEYLHPSCKLDESLLNKPTEEDTPSA